MNTSVNVLIFLGCLLLASYRAYKKGIWRASLNLLGLICAYIASFLFAPSVSEMLKSLGVGSAVAYLSALIVVFFVTTFVVSTLPVLAIPRLKEVRPSHQVGGAVLGAITGCTLAVILIWLGTLLQALLFPNSAPVETDPLSKISASTISKVAKLGLTAMDAGDEKTQITTALVSEPQAVSAAFVSLSKSKALQDLWSDGEAQFMMSENNIDGVLSHNKFQQLVGQPAMQKLMEVGRPANIPENEAERYVATKMSVLWRKMRELRSDPRMVEILEDPEFKSLVEQQNPLLLMTNKKAQDLIDIVLTEIEREEREMDADTSIDMLPSSSLPEQPIPDPIPDKGAIYKWVDEQGKTQYTDYKNTPLDKRQTAEEMTH